MKEAGKKRAKGAAVRKASTEAASPSSEEIARRAYEIFLARGREPGHEAEDWLQAEKELRGRRVRA
jgi:hypothetical protein